MAFTQIINSLLDNDLYKFTQAYAVCKQYPRAQVKYQFVNRGKTIFPVGFAEELRHQIELISRLSLSKEEQIYLTDKCGHFLGPVYIEMILSHYQYNPNEVSISQENGILDVSICGSWARTIYWEVPLLALISELYFLMEKNPLKDNYTHDHASPREEAFLKGARLKASQCKLMEFGTRRRYSKYVQEQVIIGLKRSMGEYLVGTSNVMFARENGLIPQGTQAHEWISGVAAIEGLEKANYKAMELWSKIYQGHLSIALTDTFGTPSFFRDFNKYFAQLFSGLRHDSGDPFLFGEKVIAHYKSLGIDPYSKTIIFSDGLDIETAISISQQFANRIKVIFGIGTHLTNSMGFKPLNIVIKLIEVNGTPAIKLSDVPNKEIGNKQYIDLAKIIHQK